VEILPSSSEAGVVVVTSAENSHNQSSSIINNPYGLNTVHRTKCTQSIPDVVLTVALTQQN